MKPYKFDKAKLNVTQYVEPSGKDSATTLVLDKTLSGFVNKYGLHRSVFVGANGRYLCTSALHEPFVSNTFNVDVTSVSKVSQLLEGILQESDSSLMGWSLVDSQKGYFSLIPTVCNRHYAREYAALPNIDFDSGSFEVINASVVQNYYAGKLDALVGALKSLLSSMECLELPIDLLEVSLFGAKYSEESYDEEDCETCVWEEMGSFSNTTHVLGGLSVVTEKNGFEDFNGLNGKYAMVIVV